MVQKAVYLLLTSFIFCFLLSFPIQASQFQHIVVRPDKLKQTSGTTGLICASPSSNSTESQVAITFPSNFSISQNVGNWSTDTLNILSSATPWPGISVVSVSGQTATFNSGDLATGVTYCFRWNNAAAVTTPATGENYTGSISTKTSGNTIIDSSPFALTIIPDDQISVTASVLPNASSIDIQLASSPPNTSYLHENDTLTYTIEYKSTYTTSTPLTLEAAWGQGIIQGGGNLDMVSYVNGSAVSADDGSAPIIDIQNNKITWDIPSLSASTEYHTITFQLKARSVIPTSLPVNMTSTVTALVYNSVIDQKSITHTFTSSITPTPTPNITSSPEVTVTSNPQETITDQPPEATNTPTPSNEKTYIKKAELIEITKSTATIVIESNNEVTVHVAYGTRPNNLNTYLDITEAHKMHNILLHGLIPNTRYYVTIKVKSAKGEHITSDILTLKTTKSTAVLNIKPEQITLSSDQTPLSSLNTFLVIIPVNKPIKISLTLPSSDNISSITARFENKNVLGISTANRNTPIEETKLIEVLPGTYIAELLSPPVPGTYQLVLTVHDIYGSYFRIPLPHTIIVSSPIRIVDRDNLHPIEGARVVISKYEPTAKTFSSLNSVFTIKYESDERGQLDVTLPIGSYIAEVSAPGYKSVSYKFKVDQEHADYPLIHLTKEEGVTSTVSYYKGTLSLIATFITGTTSKVFSSGIISASSVTLVQFLIICTLMLLISLRTHSGIIMTILLLPMWFVRQIYTLAGYYHKHHILIVEDSKSHQGLSGTVIHIIQNGTELYKTRTGIWGEIILSSEVISSPQSEIQLTRQDYTPLSVCLDEPSLTQDIIHLPMHKVHSSYLPFSTWLFEQSMMAFYDLSIIAMGIFGILFVKYRGLSATIPFIVFTSILITLWMIYVYKLWNDIINT